MFIVSFIAIYILGLSALVLLASFKLYSRKKRFAFKQHDYSGELPTVSVCIPARNERHAMTQCLESVLASDYEKLEVIVLDDSSVDDTSELIKAFAHSGVRFVEGSRLPAGWLGKNHALQGLLLEASGDFIIFMDVDSIITPHSISELMKYTLAEKATMVSVIPQRLDRWRTSVLLGSLRYLWLLLMDSPMQPAASTALWCVDRKQLLEVDGFTGAKDVIQPEIDIARELLLRGKFRTIISNSLLGVSFEKKWSSQIETSVRLLAPVTGTGLRSSAWLSTLFLLLLSLAAVPLGLIFHQNLLLVTGLVYGVSMVLLFSLYFSILWGRLWWLGSFLLWPFVLTQETILLGMSMLQYVRGRVTWKGRVIEKHSS
ncbi:MAG: glycosyltransferase family 2 protein [Candidatus Saccharibacteria bacterium]